MKRLSINLLAMLLTSCWAGKFATVGELATLHQDLDEERQQRQTLEEVVGQLGCPEAIRETLTNLHSACEQHSQTDEKGSSSPTCSEDAADQAINRYSIKNPKGRYFLDLLVLRHAVAYFAEGTTAIVSLRQKRLASLLKLRPLPRTRFLLATSDKPNLAEAERRVKLVKKWLTDSGLPADSLEPKDIIYDYFSDVSPKQLRPEDGPIEGSLESKQPLRHSVWVYRMDCL